MNVEPGAVAGLQELVRELAEWRLTEYLDRAQAQTGGFSTLKVSHANGKPILFLPPEPERGHLPSGWTDVQIEGFWLEGPVGDSDIINGLAPAPPDATRIDLPLQSIVAVAFAERRRGTTYSHVLAGQPI